MNEYFKTCELVCDLLTSILSLIERNKKQREALMEVQKLFYEENLTIGSGFASVYSKVCEALE